MLRPAIIKSPKATQVKAIYLSSGAKVRRGEPLLELFDFEEQKLLAEIDRAISENQSKIAEATGARVSSRVSNLSAIATSKFNALTQVQDVYGARQEQYAAGEVTFLEVLKARIDVALKTYQCLQSAVELEIYQVNLSDSLDVLNTIGSLLDSEKSYVQASVARLVIKAPRDGMFSTSITKGSPVRLGHVLGQID